MEKEVMIEGPDLQVFYKYVLDQNPRPGPKNADYVYKAKFNKGFDETLSVVDLIAVVLTGFSSALGQLLLNYSARKFTNDITIKTKDQNGTEITISMKNRTESEIRALLKESGIEV